MKSDSTFCQEKKPEISLTRVTADDVLRQSDKLRLLKDLVLSHGGMYPDIDRWFSKKVLPGLRSSERSAFIGFSGDDPIASAIVRKSNNAKFCHLHIRNEFRHDHLGEMFFVLMALEIRNYAEEVHFTLPESLWTDEQEFFESFGFTEFDESIQQYRLFERELRCSARFSEVWRAVLQKILKLRNLLVLGDFNLEPDLVLSIRPDYAQAILDGKKRVEIRRRFNERWAGKEISIYATNPQMAIVGQAKISNVVADRPESIWEQYEEDIGCSKLEFDEYTMAADRVYAIILEEVRPFNGRVLVSQLSHMLETRLVPPQSYCIASNSKEWAGAVSIAALLQNVFVTSTKETSNNNRLLIP